MPKLYEESDQARETRARNFKHHAPSFDQKHRYTNIRSAASDLASMLNTHCPPSRELSLAMTKLEEAVLWANASIARNEAADESGEPDETGDPDESAEPSE